MCVPLSNSALLKITKTHFNFISKKMVFLRGVGKGIIKYMGSPPLIESVGEAKG